MNNKTTILGYRKIFLFLCVLAMSAFIMLAKTNSFAASYVSLKIYPEHVGVFVSTGMQQFVAFGVTATGAQENITDNVDWISSDENLVKIDADGLATIQPLITAGQVKITCSYPKTGGGGAVSGPNLLLLKKKQ